MVDRKLHAKFYAAMKRYSEADEWQKTSRIGHRLYTLLFREHQNSRDIPEKNSLCKEMENVFQLCQLADIQRDRKETKEDNPYSTITRSMEKMHEAFLGRNWDLALAWNDLAYGLGYELYKKAEGTKQANLSQRLAFLHGYQELILTQQLKGNKK